MPQLHGEDIEVRVNAVGQIDLALAVLAQHGEYAVKGRSDGAVLKIDADRPHVIHIDANGILRRPRVRESGHLERDVLEERGAVINLHRVQLHLGAFIVRGIDDIAAQLAAAVRRVACVANTVRGAVETAHGISQILAQRTRNEEFIAQKIIVSGFYPVATLEFRPAGARDVVDGRTESVRVKNAAGTALHDFDSLGHEIVAHRDIVVHELHFGLFVPG